MYQASLLHDGKALDGHTALGEARYANQIRGKNKHARIFRMNSTVYKLGELQKARLRKVHFSGHSLGFLIFSGAPVL